MDEGMEGRMDEGKGGKDEEKKGSTLEAVEKEAGNKIDARIDPESQNRPKMMKKQRQKGQETKAMSSR